MSRCLSCSRTRAHSHCPRRPYRASPSSAVSNVQSSKLITLGRYLYYRGIHRHRANWTTARVLGDPKDHYSHSCFMPTGKSRSARCIVRIITIIIIIIIINNEDKKFGALQVRGGDDGRLNAQTA